MALAVAEAHVELLLVVISLFALTLTVFVRSARRLLHLMLAANSAPQTLGDVVPQLREGARRTRGAVALTGGGAACAQVGSRWAAVAHHGHPRVRVRVREGARRRGDGAHGQQHQREERCHEYLEGRQRNTVSPEEQQARNTPGAGE